MVLSSAILFAALCGRAASTNFDSLGEGNACRENSTSSCGDPCEKYDVLTGPAAASLEECKSLCEKRAACTGIEYMVGASGSRRCEVWTLPIGHSTNPQIDDLTYTCYKYVGAEKEDASLEVSLQVQISNLNLSAIWQDNTLKSLVETALSDKLAAAAKTTTQETSSITKENVAVSMASNAIDVVVLVVSPPENTNPFVIYEGFRSADGDGITSQKAAMEIAVADALSAVEGIDAVKDGDVTVSLINRVIQDAAAITTTENDDTGKTETSGLPPQIFAGGILVWCLAAVTYAEA